MPAASSGPVPLVVSISALDSRKEENIERSDLLVSHGVGVFAVDVPGTGEAPITADVGSERIFSRLLDVRQLGRALGREAGHHGAPAHPGGERLPL